MAAARRAHSVLFCPYGCRRPAQFLRPAPRRRGPAFHRPRHSRALEGHALAAGIGHRLCDALSRPVPRGGRALPRLDAGAARRRALAVEPAGAGRFGRGGRTAADRFRRRSRAAGPCAGNVVRSGRIVARSVARSRRRRPAACCGAQPAQRLGAHGHHAVRSRPALFAVANHAAPSRDLVHADRLGRGALRAADPARLVFALCRGVGARRRHVRFAVRRRATRLGHIVEATKQVYRAIPAPRREKRRLVPALEPVLAPSPGAAAMR
jgi:hypothetical protein